MKKRIIKLLAVLKIIKLKKVRPVSKKELMELASADQVKFIDFILKHTKKNLV